jgi:hypothetical protein
MLRFFFLVLLTAAPMLKGYAVDRYVTISWDYTYTSGLSCKYPMLIRMYFVGTTSDVSDIAIFKNPGYAGGTDGYPNYTSYKSYRILVPDGGSITDLRIAAGFVNNEGKCPGLPGGQLCYTGGVYSLSLSTADPCAWTETTLSICGMTNFKVKVNIAPTSGLPVTQITTTKPYYCPGEQLTLQAPCNIKDQASSFSWYYSLASGGSGFIKSTTTATLTVGQGADYNPPAGVNAYVYVTAYVGSNYMQSQLSGSFRFGAAAPTATVTPLPPTCADGSDWKIQLTNTSSSTSAVTSFKANVFEQSNSSAFPDGYVTFSGSSGAFVKGNVASSVNFAPGTQLRIELLNDYNISQYGACATNLGNYTIPNKAKITASEISGAHKNLNCYNSNDGSVQFNIVNGDGNYTIKFNDVPYAIKSGSPSNQPIIENLPANTYTVKIRDTNCDADPVSVQLTQPSPLDASIEVLKDLDCSDSQNGQLRVNISGGASSHSISWSNGNTNATATGLGPGTYTVDVTDIGCPTVTRSHTLTAPPAIGITLSSTPPTCPGGSDGTMTVSQLDNTSGTIAYSWSNGEASSQIVGLVQATYTVTVTMMDNGRNCSAQASKFLQDPPAWTAALQPVYAYNGSAIKCDGDHNGRLNVIVKNDAGQEVPGEYYTWSTGDAGTTKNYLDNLGEGSYEVRVRYKSVCEAKGVILLNAPDPVLPAITATTNYNGQPISCSGQSDANLKATATGGTGAYNYSWDTGTAGSLLTGVGAGTYAITVTDVNGCTGSNNIELIDPSPVEALITQVSNYAGYGVSCFGKNDGQITAEGNGGTGVYTYQWSDGKTSAVNPALVAGSYTVTVSDNNGCKGAATQVITSPTALALQVQSAKNISCYAGMDGEIVLVATGGVPNYAYSKNSGSSWQTDNTFGVLTAGSYNFTVHDVNGCTKTISSTLTQPSAISISFTDVQPAFCEDPRGTATAVVNGGVGNYTYQWLDNNSNVAGNSAVLSNARGGIYTLVTHDGNNCVASKTVPITSTDGASTNGTATATRCFDSSDGSAEVSIVAGDGPFVILWPGGQNSLKVSNLPRGTYNVQVTDGHDCTVIQTIEVPAPDPLELQVISQTIPTCNGTCDGQLALAAAGGVGNYTYQWNNSTAAQQGQLCAGIYPVVVTDGNACVLNKNVELIQPDPITIAVASATLPVCRDGCDGKLAVLANGGNGGYQYTWAVGGNSTVKENLCPGTYQISVVDQKNCKGEGTVVLNNTPPVPVNLGGGVTLCVGQTYTLDAGTGWKNIQWGGTGGLSSSSQQVIVNAAGQYWVEVLDVKNCVGRDTFLLATSYDLLKASFLIPKEAVAGDTVAIIDISWPLPESIEWRYPEQMATIEDLGNIVYGKFKDAGTYEVTLTAHLGECRDEVSKNITILEGEVDDSGGRLGYTEYLKLFTLYPNPNEGAFEVGIELAEEGSITLSAWNAQTGAMLGKMHHADKSQYKIKVDLRPLSAGTYVLRLDHAKGTAYMRFVVY